MRDGWVKMSVISWLVVWPRRLHHDLLTGKALCLRANLAADEAAAAKLYAAAVQKFELALDLQPEFAAAMQGAALALRDLAYCQPPGSMDAVQVRWGRKVLP